MAEKYGPVMAFYLGPSKVFVSVCGFDAVQEALRNPDLDGRYESATFKERTMGEKLGIVPVIFQHVKKLHDSVFFLKYHRTGLMFVDGELWQEQRRFTLRHLRDLGFGRTSSESLFEEEIHHLLEDLRTSALSNSQGVVDFKGVFSVSIINVLWSIIGGERFERTDAKFIRLLDTIELFFRSGNVATANLPIPEFLFKKFPVLYKVLGTRGDLFVGLQDFIKVKPFFNHPETENDASYAFGPTGEY